MYSVTKLKFKKNYLQLNIKGKDMNKVSSVVLRYRGKLEEDVVEYDFEIISVSAEFMMVRVELNKIELKVIYWDVFVKTAEKEFPLQVGKLRNIIRFPLYDGKYRENGTKMFMHPYITPDLTLGFQYREYTKHDRLGFRIGEAFTYGVFLATKFIWNKKKIVLIYEKFCMMAQDNGYYFFKYCMDNGVEEKMGIKIYYIIDKKSPDLDKLQDYQEHLVYFMSFKHKLYMLGAKLLVSTDTKKHAYAWRMRMSILEHMVRKKRLVFLQHGVIALKRIEQIYGKGAMGQSDLFIVSSEYEKNIVKDNFGYSDKEIAVTGLARWDVLHDKSVDGRMVLVMPTWRNWLEELNPQAFMESEYYKQYSLLLSSTKLLDMLEMNNLELCFYIHPKFKDYIDKFVSNNHKIRIVQFGEEQLNELLMKCKMLVTDYSSVSWDVYYQGKPVVFYQFDLQQYMEANGSYMDMDKELFGECKTDVEGLIAVLSEYANNNFELKDKYASLREYYFRYIDNDNSKRICESMSGLLE